MVIFDSSGYALQSAWYHDEGDNAWLFLDPDCKIARCSNDKPLWKCIDSGFYVFDKERKMYFDCVTPYGWDVDENGTWVR